MQIYFCENCGSKIPLDDSAALSPNAKLLCAHCAPTSFSAPAIKQPITPTTIQSNFGNASKFWFCENCGKRLTEQDLEAGTGRDKQAKGVWCSECAVGVQTEQFIVRKRPATPPVPPAVPPRRQRTPSNVALKTVDSAIATQPPPRPSSPVARPLPAAATEAPTLVERSRRSGLLLLLIGLGAITAVLLMLSTSNPSPAKVLQEHANAVKSELVVDAEKPADETAVLESRKPELRGRDLSFALGEGITIDFVYITPGTFMMGVPTSNHRVTLTQPFYIAKYETTRAQYAVVTKIPETAPWITSQVPVEPTFAQSQDFCAKLSKTIGRPVTLPSEAQWEYACRAGSTTIFLTGNDETGLDRIAWYSGNGDRKIHPVGTKAPNAWGLYDMIGNASEWVEDTWSNLSLLPAVDPLNISRSETRRVARGGGVGSSVHNYRSGDRLARLPQYPCGFRVIIPIKESQ